MKKQSTSVGKNLTGMAMSPIDGKKLAEFAAQAPVSQGNEHEIQEQRETFNRTSGTVGSVPPPSSVRGLASMGLDALKGQKASVFIDKLSERLAFERTGARLYEALIAKYDALGSFEGGPGRARLLEIRDDEIRHAGILEDAVLSLGGDPTVMTPCADLAGVESAGIVQVLTDPRTTLDQALDAILVAELVDNERWAVLGALADGLGHTQLGDMFREALAEEELHLEDVRTWVAAWTQSASNAELPVQPPAASPPAAP